MPVVASYCTTFLKPEMRHIYRQLTGLREFEAFVITKSRENADEYPFDAVEVLPRARIHFVARFLKKYVQRLEPVFYRGEYDQLNDVLSGRRADLLHVYFGHTGVHLLPFIKNWPGPSLVSFHGMDVMLRDEEPGYNGRLRSLLRTVPMVLARSDSLAARLIDLGADPARIRLNRTSIPLDNFPAVERTVPGDGGWRLVQASRLIEKKGIDTALHAFASFRTHFPAATFTLAGDGPLESSLRRLSETLGVADGVQFLGFQSQEHLRQLYHRSHIFVHPSQTTERKDQEGIPNAMLEAMATGLPVVATLHGGIPEAVAHEKTGLLTPERDSHALFESLMTIASNPERYQAFGSAAAASVREKFDQRSAIASLEACYRELIEAHARLSQRPPVP